MIKRFFKRLLRYVPLDTTAPVRRMLATVATPALPYCPDWEGDFIWTIITRAGYRTCLETGFGTGSTALYMLDATKTVDGRVTSIDWSEAQFNDIGRANVINFGEGARHSLIEEASWKVFPRLLNDGRQIEFAFIDGWKTFDYLAYEMFILNRILAVGGVIVFDDAYLPSVRKIIALLKSHLGYQELDYAQHGETWRLRLFHILTRRSFHRPYRAVKKAIPIEDQAPSTDWTFFRRF